MEIITTVIRIIIIMGKEYQIIKINFNFKDTYYYKYFITNMLAEPTYSIVRIVKVRSFTFETFFTA